MEPDIWVPWELSAPTRRQSARRCTRSWKTWTFIPVPSQQRVRCDQGFKLVQDFAPQCLRFSGESTAFGIGETKAPTTHALLKHAVLFLVILNHVQLVAVDPTG